jgi:hypothetical protein
MKRTLTPSDIAAADTELSESPNERAETDGLRAKIRSRLNGILQPWLHRNSATAGMASGAGKTPSHLLTSGHEELENARSSARLYFESRGLEVPSFLKPRKASASLEVELATVRADTEAAKIFLAGTRADTARLRAEAQRLEKEHREWESSPEGQKVLQLRSESRQMLSNILQIDADVARSNRNAMLLSSFCQYHFGSSTPNLPPPVSVSRYSSDLPFLLDWCRRFGFDVPADLTTIDQVSNFVRSEVPAQLPERQPPAANTEEQAASPAPAKPRKVVSRKKRPPKESSEAAEHVSGLGF